MFDEVPLTGRLITEMYIFCRPYPLGRPRMRKDGSGVYQPLENQAEMREEMLAYHREVPIDRPVVLVARLFYQRPPYQPLPHVSRYDVDNLAKAIADNLVDQNIITDDRLILKLDITKSYSAEDYMVIRIHEVEHGIEDVPGGMFKGNT